MNMKLTILTLGTRGDVQPYIALGQKMQTYGHEVTIATGESFKCMIEAQGIKFIPTALDLMKIAQSPEGKKVLEQGIKDIKGALTYAKKVINPAYRKSLDDFWHASQNADILIYHPKVLGAVDIADALQIPAVCLSPVPIIYPIKEFPNLALAPKGNFGPFLNKLTYKLFGLAEKNNIKEINDFRQKTLKISKRKSGVFIEKNSFGREIPIIYPISPSLFSFVKSWDGHVYVPGFFFLEESGPSLSSDIIDFVQKGTPPIVISFSSMPVKNPETLKEKLCEALKQTDNRAIFITGNSGFENISNQDILVVPEAPHQLLFPLSKGVIHHAGAGTMAAVLKAGVPQLAIPYTADQPFWAHILLKNNLVPFVLTEDKLTVEHLVKALLFMESKTSKIAAQDIQNKIAQEDGVNHACAFLEKIASQNDK